MGDGETENIRRSRFIVTGDFTFFVRLKERGQGTRYPYPPSR